MYISEYLRQNNISIDELIEKKVKKESIIIPFNNRTSYGNNIKTKLADKISITKPKFWPKKGYFEIK